MTPEELDLVPLDDLMEAIQRRCTSMVLLAVREAKVSDDGEESLTVMHGSRFTTIGLMTVALRGAVEGVHDDPDEEDDD